MGWDYDARAGKATYHLTMSWGGYLTTALDSLGAFDWNAEPPEPPPAVLEERDEDDPWPFECRLSDREVAYFAFESSHPGKVPGVKMMDNSLWLISPDEAGVLADLLELSLIDRDGLQALEGANGETLRKVLEEFSDFCRQAARQGGFWAY